MVRADVFQHSVSKCLLCAIHQREFDSGTGEHNRPVLVPPPLDSQLDTIPQKKLSILYLCEVVSVVVLYYIIRFFCGPGRNSPSSTQHQNQHFSPKPHCDKIVRKKIILFAFANTFPVWGTPPRSGRLEPYHCLGMGAATLEGAVVFADFVSNTQPPWLFQN